MTYSEADRGSLPTDIQAQNFTVIHRKIQTSEAMMRHLIIFLKLALSVSILATAGGCVRRPMNDVIASWQSRQASEVIAAWGKPSEELNLEGSRLLIWHTVAGQLAPPAAKKPALAIKSGYCTRLLKADRKGRIFEGTWDGDDCPVWFSGWAR